jgi:hypothetical protein
VFFVVCLKLYLICHDSIQLLSIRPVKLSDFSDALQVCGVCVVSASVKALFDLDRREFRQKGGQVTKSLCGCVAAALCISIPAKAAVCVRIFKSSTSTVHAQLQPTLVLYPAAVPMCMSLLSRTPGFAKALFVQKEMMRGSAPAAVVSCRSFGPA